MKIDGSIVFVFDYLKKLIDAFFTGPAQICHGKRDKLNSSILNKDLFGCDFFFCRAKADDRFDIECKQGVYAVFAYMSATKEPVMNFS